jgi:hypothetical protein
MNIKDDTSMVAGIVNTQVVTISLAIRHQTLFTRSEAPEPINEEPITNVVLTGKPKIEELTINPIEARCELKAFKGRIGHIFPPRVRICLQSPREDPKASAAVQASKTQAGMVN